MRTTQRSCSRASDISTRTSRGFELLYTAPHMAATRTQIYLTKRQRARLDALAKREDKSLAELIREAVDIYLEQGPVDLQRALDETFGASPDLEVPDRSEWDRGYG